VLNNKELSEECLNTVLLKIWEKAVTYDEGRENFEGWVFSIAKFCAIDILRKEVRHYNSCEIGDRDFDANENIENKIEMKEELQRVVSVIESLGEPDNEIFVKRFMMNFRVKDIADSLNMSEKAVSLRILRGRKKLKDLLGEM
ncbi:MAG: sigma-70 family RNA polymerase sigma factor, partial [Clostridium sp.]